MTNQQSRLKSHKPPVLQTALDGPGLSDFAKSRYCRARYWHRRPRPRERQREWRESRLQGGFFFSSGRRHTRSVSAFLLNRSSDLQELLLLVYELNRSGLLAENEKIRPILAQLEKLLLCDLSPSTNDSVKN